MAQPSSALVTTRLGVPLHQRLAWQYSLRMRPGQSLLLAASLAAATHGLQVGVCARGLTDWHACSRIQSRRTSRISSWQNASSLAPRRQAALG